MTARIIRANFGLNSISTTCGGERVPPGWEAVPVAHRRMPQTARDLWVPRSLELSEPPVAICFGGMAGGSLILEVRVKLGQFAPRLGAVGGARKLNSFGGEK